jgi:uncharacterized protein (TIGR03437 family)
MVIAPDGSLYIAGKPGTFQATAGAFQSAPGHFAAAGVVHVDSALKNVLAATYFGTVPQIQTLTVDPAGNVYIGGNTLPQGLPTRTPLAGGFAATTGFVSELSADLSTLLFSSYFGDTHTFAVSSIAIGANGSLVLGGTTGHVNGEPANLWLNSLTLTPPPAFRIDSIENAATVVDGPISGGETILITGAGFGSNAQLSIGGEAVTPLAITPTAITATVPSDLATSAPAVLVRSAGAVTNQVLMPLAVTSPGVFSANGSGAGQGYILNSDGTFNSPGNPASPGSRITVFATGVGPVSFTNGYAVPQYPVNVFVNGYYCAGVAAVMGPVTGLPGNVFQITVYVPARAGGQNALQIQVNGVYSQNFINISVAQ